MNRSIFDKLRGAYCALCRHTRKNNHLMFFIKGYLRYYTPFFILKFMLHRMMRKYECMTEEEKKQIQNRVDYYCKFTNHIDLPDDAPALSLFKYKQRESYVHDYVNSTYFFDAVEYIRFFKKSLRWAYNPGDVNYLFPVPEITKSRPLTYNDENRNNILMNLDKVRHFTWIYDPFKWEDKECGILFRGNVDNKPRRVRFIEMWHNHPWCDVEAGGHLSIYEHLHYRYIMALEGNDVASNLKWVMSSNSIAVMPRPTCETWYMEGKLIPDYHYLEIASDYHDLIEKVQYCEDHPEFAKAIVQHAHEWTMQFRKKDVEDITSILVLQKYFKRTGQNL